MTIKSQRRHAAKRLTGKIETAEKITVRRKFASGGRQFMPGEDVTELAKSFRHLRSLVGRGYLDVVPAVNFRTIPRAPRKMDPKPAAEPVVAEEKPAKKVAKKKTIKKAKKAEEDVKSED